MEGGWRGAAVIGLPTRSERTVSRAILSPSAGVCDPLLPCAGVAELADARDSKSRGLTAREGSIPSSGTT